MSFSLLHIADAHLGGRLSNFGAYAERRRAEVSQAFERAIDVAIDRRVDIVLFAGDLFDRRRPPEAVVNVARGGLARLRAAGIGTLAVPGTHDRIAHPDNVYRSASLPFDHVFEQPAFLPPRRIERAGREPVFVYGIAFDPERTAEAWRNLRRTREDGIHVAVAHAACRDSPGWSIPADDLPFEPADLGRTGLDYIALGHYHNLRLFEHRGRTIAAYPGSIEGRNWSETGPRHVVLVEWSDVRTAPTVEPIEVQTRRLATADLDIGDLRDDAGVREMIERSFDAGALWRIRLCGDPEFTPSIGAIRSELEATLGWVELEDETTLVTSRLVRDRCEEATVRGEFFRRLVAERDAAADDRERRVADRAIKLGVRVLG